MKRALKVGFIACGLSVGGFKSGYPTNRSLRDAKLLLKLNQSFLWD